MTNVGGFCVVTGDVYIFDLFDEIIEFLPYNHLNARSIKSLSKAWQYAALMSQHWQGHIRCFNRCCVLLNPTKGLPKDIADSFTNLLVVHCDWDDDVPYPPLSVDLEPTGASCSAIARVYFASWPAEHVVAASLPKTTDWRASEKVNTLVLDAFGGHALRYFVPCNQPVDYSKCSKVRYLGLASQSDFVTDQTLRVIAALCPEMRFLDVTICQKITDDGLSCLKALSQLSSLDVSACGGVIEKGIKHLADVQSLTALDISYARGVTSAAQQLKKIEGLRTLSAINCDLTDEALGHIGELTSLRSLRISSNHDVTDAGLHHLKNLTSLTALRIGSRLLTDAGLSCLDGLSNLAQLELRAVPKVTSEGFRHLREHHKLTSLGVWCTPLSDEQMEQISCIASLTTLELCDVNITEVGVSHLSRLTGLKDLMLYFCGLSDNCLRHLSALSSLTSLSLPSNKGINGDGLRHLKAMKSLRCLDVSLTSVTNDALVHLQGIKSLRELRVVNCAVTKKSVQALQLLGVRVIR